MPPSNAWDDPRTWFAAGGLVVGVCGFFFGVLSFYWNRRESRLEALSKILQSLVKAAQHLHEANACRRQCEQLKLSFPQAAPASEAVQRINKLVEKYDEHIKESRDDFRLAESEFAPRSFRFPDKIARLVQKAPARGGRKIASPARGGRKIALVSQGALRDLRFPGCAARPWALGSNSFGVKNGAGSMRGGWAHHP